MDYAEDLGRRFNPADVRLACSVWRQSDTKRMPTPGELIAKAHALTASASVTALPPPAPIPFLRDPAVLAGLKQLASQLGRKKDLRRRSGENDVAVARRLWPNREVSPRYPRIAAE